MAIDGQIGVRHNHFWDKFIKPDIPERDRKVFKILGVACLALSFLAYKADLSSSTITATFLMGSWYTAASYTGNSIYVFAGAVSAVASLIIGTLFLRY